MSTKAESADLVLKLYELRREKKMRKARNWIFDFTPSSADEYLTTMMDPKVGPYLRMATSYWDMATALVNQQCIDAEVFNATNSEHFIVFAKIEPILADLRDKYGRPALFSNLETMINNTAGGPERLKATQEWLVSVAQQRNADGATKEDKKSAGA